MNMNFSLIEQVMTDSTHTVFPSAQLEIRFKGETIFSKSYGHLDPETKQRPTQPDTLFDLASVTKLFVTTAFMTLVEEGKVSLDHSVQSVLPDFNGARPIQGYEDPLKWGSFVSVSDEQGTIDAATITFRHLLIHTSGLPAWRPLFQQPEAESAKRMAIETHFSYRTGTKVVYSDIGLILLGMAIEKLTQQKLDDAVYSRVTVPLGLAHARYLPITNHQLPITNVAPTEFDNQWRKRRVVGEVHDENAYRLGGVSGHAGLFANATDLATFGQTYLSRALLRGETINEMTRLQSQFNATRRGIGFVLWSPDPEASGNPFSEKAFGHTGFTGTSLWIDPERDLVVACLTNEVYNGRENRKIAEFRVNVHKAIIEVIGK
ncbi:MAG: beta-lactamase family protein [Chloroflexi bacterium]|nr:beta-lactamase family protein [Chloroflexota bacterium]MBI5712590.1 beta-lactamase family protein [Chloroflexota bacterium]